MDTVSRISPISKSANAPTGRPLTPLAVKLQGRHIAQAAQAAGWHEHQYYGAWGWRYPVIDLNGQRLAWRWKNGSSQGSKKYSWPGGKGHARWYFADPAHFIEAVTANGEIWLANGEPAALAFVAAGFSNVLSWFGERNLPDGLGADLAAWGVRRVFYPADNDDTGRASAAKVRDALADTGIQFVPLAWGDVPSGYDANDLLMDCQGDAGDFAQRLASLPRLILPREERQPQVTYDSAPDEADPHLVSQLAQRLGVAGRGRHAGGWMRGKRIPNPVESHPHDAKRPASVLNLDTGVLYDHRRDEAYGPFTVAKALGIDITPYRRQRPQNNQRTRVDTPEPDGLQDASEFWDSIEPVRKAAPAPEPTPRQEQAQQPAPDPDAPYRMTWGELKWSWVLPAHFRTFLYTASHAGMTSGTAEEWAEAAAAAGLPLKAHTVRRMAEKGLFYIFVHSTSSKDMSTKMSKNAKGRPETCYSLPDIATLHQLIKDYGYSRLMEMAMVDGKEILPMYARDELLTALEVDGKNRDLLAALDTITERLKARDSEYARQIDRAYARFRNWYSQLLADLRSSDFADDFSIEPDLQHADGFSAACILAAQLARHYAAQRPDENISRAEWCIALGVSNGSLKKVLTLAGIFRPDGQPPEKLVRLEAANPFDAPAEVRRISREIKGRPLRVCRPDDADGQPYNAANLMAAVLQDEAIYIRFSVAGPWEKRRATPDELEAVKRKPEVTTPAPQPEPAKERAPRRPTWDEQGINPFIARAWLDNLLTDCGWQRDEGDAWADPRRNLWPDHPPTLLQALTGVKVDGALEAVDHRQNNGKTAVDAPQPGPQAPAPIAPPETPETAEFAPAAAIRADKPDAWADRPAFAELTRPTIFNRR